MDDSGKEGPREQHNYGSGLLIGRDNHGDIRYEMLDRKTKAMLAKLSTDAPALANLLTEALRDGVISSDAIESLWLAGTNINEDVAESLWLAGTNINNGVAEKILQAAETLSKATDGLDDSLYSLDRTVEKFNGGSGISHLTRLAGTITNAAERIERVFTPPPPKIIISRKGRFKAFVWGVALGVAAFGTVVLLIHHHVKPF